MIKVFLSIGLFSPSDLGGHHEQDDAEAAWALPQEDPFVG